jgi:hypothetical protein
LHTYNLVASGASGKINEKTTKEMIDLPLHAQVQIEFGAK